MANTILTPEPIRVLTCPHPFSSERFERTMGEGMTIREIMDALQLSGHYLHARVLIDDRLVPQAQWETASPRKGQMVVVRVIPTGGGEKDLFRVIAMIGVMALAVAAPYLAPVGWGLVGAWTGAALSATISIVGALAISALIPPPKQQFDKLSGSKASTSPTLSLTGVRNQFAPYGPVPQVLGTHRMFPPLAARPYTEIQGTDQYLHALFNFGYGPLVLDDFKIGETALTEFSDYELSIIDNYNGTDDIPLFPVDTFEDELSVALTNAAGWQQRTSQLNATELSVDVAFLSGLGEFDAQGNLVSRSVTLEMQYRAVGAGTWIDVAQPAVTATATTALGGNRDLTFTAVESGHTGNNIVVEYYQVSWYAASFIQITYLGSLGGRIAVYMGPNTTATQVMTALNTHASTVITTTLAGGSDGSGIITTEPITHLSGGLNAIPTHVFTDNRMTLLRYSRRWHVAPGQYEIQVRRTTADSASTSIRDAVTWTMLRTFQIGTPVRKQGVTLAALRVRATDQLNGVLDEFNAVVKTVCLDWDGTGWIMQTTNNPASLFRHVLQGRANARQIAVDRIDLPTLQAWHGRCVTGGRTYNAVRDFASTVYETLRDVAAMGRASYTLRDGLHSVVEDLPQDTPVQIFSPRNSWGFRATKVLTTIPHALRCRFVNASTGYIQDVRPVYNDGYNADGTGGLTAATRLEEIDLPGCDNADLAYKQGRYLMAVQILRPELFKLSTDFENLVCTRGDRVEVVHDVPLFALGQSRIADVTYDSSGNLTTLTLDEPITMEEGVVYGIRVRGHDGTQYTRDLVTVAGSNETVTLDSPMALTYPAAQDLSGNDLHGTYVGGPRLETTGLLDGDEDTAVALVGPNGDHITCGTSTLLDVQAAMSVEFLITQPTFAADGATTQRVCGKMLNSNNRYSVNVDTLGRYGINLNYLGVNYSALSQVGAALNTRTHVVITFNSATPLVYINGVAVATAANGAGITGLTTFTVGRYSATIGRLTATVDELAKYNSVLSPARVAAHYAAVTAGGYEDEVLADTPVGYWRFGEFMPSPYIGDLLTYGLSGQESVPMIVKAIEPGPDLTAELTLVDYAPGVQNADTEVIPAYDSHITQPVSESALLPVPIITQVVSDERVLVRNQDGTLQSRIVVNVSFASGTRLRAAALQVQHRRSGSEGPWTDQWMAQGTTQDVSITGVEDGVAYDIRLRYENAGAVSEWTTILEHTVVGKTSVPANVAGFTATLQSFNVLLSWTANSELDLAGYEIRRGASWATATFVTRVAATSYTVAAPSTGSTTYLIKALDVVGNESATEASDDVSVGGPAAANPSASFDGSDVVLTWSANPGAFPIAQYEIRYGGTFASATVVQRVQATSFRRRADWLGARTWWVVGIDVFGNVGTESSTATTVLPAVTTSITPVVIDNTVLLRWAATVGTLPIQNYEVRRGAVFASAEVLGNADTTFDVIIETVAGTKTYWIAPVDSAGNTGTELGLAVTVDSPPDFILRDTFLSDFMDDRTNVQRLSPDRVSLRFDGVDDYAIVNPFSQMPATTLTCEFKAKSTGSGDGMVSYAVSGQANEFLVVGQQAISIYIKGTAVNTLYAINDGEFHDVAVRWRSSDGTVQLVVDGVQRYSTTGVQTGASITNGGSLVIGCDQDSVAGGFTELFDGDLDELRIWNEFRSDANIIANEDKELIGTETNLNAYWRLNEREGEVINDLSNNDLDGDIVGAAWHVPANQMLAPFDTAAIVSDRLTVHGYTTPQAQITAGFPYVAQPVPTTAALTAYYDAGLVLPATRIVVTPNETVIMTGVTLSVQISVRETTGDSWTALDPGTDAIGSDFRYIKVAYSWVSDGEGFALYDALETVLRTKLKTDAGTVNVTANPTAVTFGLDFLDVESITATAQGTAARHAVVDFTDVPNPTGFNLYLFDAAGAAATGPVAWQARGN